jgi:hypothetical protein
MMFGLRWWCGCKISSTIYHLSGNCNHVGPLVALEVQYCCCTYVLHIVKEAVHLLNHSSQKISLVITTDAPEKKNMQYLE